MRDEDRYWIAGLFEGEACFGVKRMVEGGGTRRYAYPVIQLYMTDQDVLQKVVNIVCHGVVRGPYFREGKSPVFAWTIQGKKALELMDKLEDLMCSRRKEKINHIREVAVGRIHA